MSMPSLTLRVPLKASYLWLYIIRLLALRAAVLSFVLKKKHCPVVFFFLSLTHNKAKCNIITHWYNNSDVNVTSLHLMLSLDVEPSMFENET